MTKQGKPSIIIETRRLVLKHVERGDFDALEALWTDENVTEYIGGPRNIDELRKTIDEGVERGIREIDQWPVVEIASGKIIGDCGLIEKEVDGARELEIIYVFCEEVWGEGYATEAAIAIQNHAINRLGWNRVIAVIDPENIASRRVAEKIGMRLEKEILCPDNAKKLVYSFEESS